MFVGRARELKILEDMHRSEKFEFAVIYGRRRVGKTALIREFLRGKKAIYFTGIEGAAQQNLENFSTAIFADSSDSNVGAIFSSFQSALEHIFKRAEKERLVLVIDEYPYVAREQRSLASTLQMLIDKNHETSHLMLILCGSSMSYMEDHVLAYKAPLYGRRTGQLKLQPFSFADTCRMLEGVDPVEQLALYGIYGGTPQYLLQVNKGLSIAQNIIRTFLTPASFIYEEPENLLKQELRQPALYNSIVAAIAVGASRMNEIASKVGLENNSCSVYLKNLISLEVIDKELPYGESVSRRAIYKVADNMFRFWYRYVPIYASLLEQGLGEAVWKRIEPDISRYLGPVFESVCREYLMKSLIDGDCPVFFKSLGRWWGTDLKTRSQTEIDIMGEQDRDTAVFAECKWTNEPVGSDVLEMLDYRSKLFAYHNVHLYLFSKSGFTDGCRAQSNKMHNVHLVDYGILSAKLLQ